MPHKTSFVIIILINIILYNKNKRFQQNKDKIITYANIKINDLFIFKNISDKYLNQMIFSFTFLKILIIII